jgi:hypothetical protein
LATRQVLALEFKVRVLARQLTVAMLIIGGVGSIWGSPP